MSKESKAKKRKSQKRGIVIGSLASVLVLGTLLGAAGYESAKEPAANELKPLIDWKEDNSNWDTKFQKEILDNTTMLEAIRYRDVDTTRHQYNDFVVRQMIDENVLGDFSLKNAFLYAAPAAKDFRENKEEYRAGVRNHLENQDKNLLFDFLNSYCKTSKFLLKDDGSPRTPIEKHELLVKGEEDYKATQEALNSNPENFTEGGQLKPEFQEQLDNLAKSNSLDSQSSYINKGLGTVISVEYVDEANEYCGIPLTDGFRLTGVIASSANENLSIIKENFQIRDAKNK